jgi:hypothetical protein
MLVKQPAQPAELLRSVTIEYGTPQRPQVLSRLNPLRWTALDNDMYPLNHESKQ